MTRILSFTLVALFLIYCYKLGLGSYFDHFPHDTWLVNSYWQLGARLCGPRLLPWLVECQQYPKVWFGLMGWQQYLQIPNSWPKKILIIATINSVLSRFWALWNLPVHRWCVRHLYKPLLRVILISKCPKSEESCQCHYHDITCLCGCFHFIFFQCFHRMAIPRWLPCSSYSSPLPFSTNTSYQVGTYNQYIPKYQVGTYIQPIYTNIWIPHIRWERTTNKATILNSNYIFAMEIPPKAAFEI